jgi:hypothetical protein
LARLVGRSGKHQGKGVEGKQVRREKNNKGRSRVGGAEEEESEEESNGDALGISVAKEILWGK